jgi:hypothetical protein
MSRSRRKTPVTGVTKAARGMRDQVLAHRRWRRWVRTALAHDKGHLSTSPRAWCGSLARLAVGPRRWT